MDWPGNSQPGPAQNVARLILGEDVTQIDDYTERVKRIVGKVLTGNGITHYERGTYDLVGGVAEGFCVPVELSDAVTWPKASVAEPLRDQLLQLCRQRHDAFRMQRGEEVGCLLTQKPAASGTGAATAPRSAARPSTRCSSGPRAAANARAGYCLANPAPKGPGGGPHHAQEPWRLGRPQQPAGPLLPLQCRQAMGGESKPTAWRAHRRADGWEPLGTSETQCLAVARERTAMRS
jgi:hypothetical protein